MLSNWLAVTTEGRLPLVEVGGMTCLAGDPSDACFVNNTAIQACAGRTRTNLHACA